MRFQSIAAWTPQTMAMQIERVTTHHSSLRAWADAAYAEFYARTEVHDRGEGGLYTRREVSRLPCTE